MNKLFYKISFPCFLVFLFSWVIVCGLGVNSLLLQSEDTLPATFLPVTIIEEGTLYLDKYYEMMVEKYPHPDDKKQERGLTPYYLKKIGDHYASAFPIITPLLAIPVYFLPLKLGMAITWDNLIILSHISAALIVALSGGVFYKLLKKHFDLDEKKTTLLTAIYLFGTVNFAMISQAMWQHGTVQLFALLALYYIFEKKWFWSAFMMGFAVLSRPTAAIIVCFLLLLVLKDEFSRTNLRELDASRGLALISCAFKRGLLYLLGFAPAILFFLWYNNTYYLDISNQGYSSQLFSSWLSPFPEGFLGMWLSPSKGILVYSPVLIFMFVGFYASVKKRGWEMNLNNIVYLGIVLTHTLILSVWKHWYGGYGFGYRMASDVIPFMVLLIVPYVKSDFFEKTKILFYFLIAFSIGVQMFGLVFFDGIWHAAYDDGFRNTKWLWSIKDSELAFNFRRILVKFGLLQRACRKCL